MKKNILSFSQAFAIEHGLDIVDVVLLDMINAKLKSDNSEKREIGGEQYVWVSYKSIIEWLPILGLKKRSLAARLNRLADKGIVKKYVEKEKGNFTFFTLCSSDSIPMQSKLHTLCSPDSIPMQSKLHTKSNRDKPTKIEEKEKDNNKLLSKKKDDESEFDTAFEQFMSTAVDNGDFKYSLRGYRIKDYTALLMAFKTHVTNMCKQSEFVENGDVRNRRWMLRAMPYMDLSKATGCSLGYGEYLKDGRRLYKNRNGKEIEVPMDAPPRRQGTIWYKEQCRWGPDI